MTVKGKNIKNSTGKESDPIRLFEGGKISWSRTKEEVWNEMSERITDQNITRSLFQNSNWIRYAVAASVVLLMGFSAIMRFYSTALETKPGEHLTASLPDGSLVQINAESSLTYKPLWYKFNREIIFEGEGFFEVIEGNDFVVKSIPGKTVVLGTSFNILSRNSEYEVTCVSGKVKVVASESHNEAILIRNEKAIIEHGGTLNIIREVNTEHETSWIRNEFFFTSVSLDYVFQELSRQYNVIIECPETKDYIYTGNFIKDQNLENVLELVCKPFGINFVKETSGIYRIVLNE